MRRALFRMLLVLFCGMGNPIYAAELKIVFSQYTPPYVFENGSGIVVDIVRTALEAGGHTVRPMYVPIERGFRMFSERQVDGTTIIQESSGLKAEYSDNFMQFHNRVFALKSRNLVIRNLADLGDKSIVAFQYAGKYLGKDFASVVAGNKRYKEMAQQDAQTQMLLLGRIDVAVMDESVFRYYRQKLIVEKKVDQALEFTSFDVFPPTPYKAAFIDRKVRDDFNRAVAAMRKDGRYDAIYRKYTEQYFSVRK
jgi:polar amino acid transport system substrate-binding protein